MKMGSQNRRRKNIISVDLYRTAFCLYVWVSLCVRMCTSCNSSFSRTWRCSSLNALMDEKRQDTFGDPSCFKMDALKISFLPLPSSPLPSPHLLKGGLSPPLPRKSSSHLISPSFPLRMTLSHPYKKTHFRSSLSSPFPYPQE